MTIEDPIEFLIRDKRSIVNQREVGVDTMSFSQALKSALRQDPDVILVGEMRDLETIETAMHRGRDGPPGDVDAAHPRRDRDDQPHHLGLPAAPAEADAPAARLGAARRWSRSAWCPAPTARAAWRRWRSCASPARVQELIEDKDRTKEIPDAIAQGHVSLRHADLRPVADVAGEAGAWSRYQEALRQATNPDDFALRFQGVSSTSDSKWDDFEGHPPENRPVPGSQSFGQQNQQAAGPPGPRRGARRTRAAAAAGVGHLAAAGASRTGGVAGRRAGGQERRRLPDRALLGASPGHRPPARRRLPARGRETLPLSRRRRRRRRARPGRRAARRRSGGRTARGRSARGSRAA